MRLRVEEIKTKPIQVSAEEPVTGYPALMGLSNSGECEFLAPVKIDLKAEREYDHLRVEGTVGTRVRLQCSRCLEQFEKDIVSSSFTLFYNKRSGLPLDNDSELKEEDLLTVPYDGDYIDFTTELEEQLIMEIPYKSLCKEECKGLCSNCGANLNYGACGCGGEGTGFKFGALKDFKVNK